LSHIRELRHRYHTEFDALPDEPSRARRLTDLNVIHQARHVAQTLSVANAWRRERSISVHAFVYTLENGLIRDLGTTLQNRAEAERLRQKLRVVPTP
jgi:carbonic anhydrase